jgi:hypothetical protein
MNFTGLDIIGAVFYTNAETHGIFYFSLLPMLCVTTREMDLQNIRINHKNGTIYEHVIFDGDFSC